jgi:hypothetical protein
MKTGCRLVEDVERLGSCSLQQVRRDNVVADWPNRR